MARMGGLIGRASREERAEVRNDVVVWHAWPCDDGREIAHAVSGERYIERAGWAWEFSSHGSFLRSSIGVRLLACLLASPCLAETSTNTHTITGNINTTARNGSLQ